LRHVLFLHTHPAFREEAPTRPSADLSPCMHLAIDSGRLPNSPIRGHFLHTPTHRTLLFFFDDPFWPTKTKTRRQTVPVRLHTIHRWHGINGGRTGGLTILDEPAAYHTPPNLTVHVPPKARLGVSDRIGGGGGGRPADRETEERDERDDDGDDDPPEGIKEDETTI